MHPPVFSRARFVAVLLAVAAATIGPAASVEPSLEPHLALSHPALEPVAALVTPSSTAPTTTSSAPTTTSTTSTTSVPAPPAFDPADTAPGWEQRRGAAALARLRFDPHSVGYTIDFLPGQPGHLGMTYPQGRTIDIWVRADESLDLLAHVIAHELGHAVDLTWNSDARRSAYLAARGISAREWFTCNGCTDFSTPAGDFAEVFAVWAAGTAVYRSALAPLPSPAALQQLAPFFGPS